MKYLLSLVLLTLTFSCGTSTAPEISSTTTETTPAAPPRVKNVILMIGDGMGLTQITGGMYANGDKLMLERLKKIGFIKTYSADNLITDSAAGATAFSCGVKTYNKAIGVNTDTVAVETILEMAKKKGLATGLVATASITHATPASFYAHQPFRKQMEKNVADLLITQPDVFMGGGKNYFEARKEDDRNISNELREVGYSIVYNVADVPVDATKVGVLIADEEPPSFKEGRGDYLTEATVKTLDILSKDEDGFFLMVEGSQIDWGGHANESDYITSEMIDFDKAIGKVLEFAEKDGQTLVIITADHETGGYAIVKGDVNDKANFEAKFSTGHHTATLIPVFSYGPQADEFTGIYQNTDIFYKMKAALGL